MNIPNLLTILRIFFVPLLVAALVQENVALHFRGATVTNVWLALAIFLCAASTDLLDGYLARRWRQITTIGTLLDPIADKLLISSALIALVQVRAVPAWMVILIVGREFAVSGLRAIAAAEGYIIKASDLGQDQDGVPGGGHFMPAAEHPVSRAGDARDGADVGRGGVRHAFGLQLLPEVLAQDRQPHQEAPTPRITAHRET